jgi:hypothetical protein
MSIKPLTVEQLACLRSLEEVAHDLVCVIKEKGYSPAEAGQILTLGLSEMMVDAIGGIDGQGRILASVKVSLIMKLVLTGKLALDIQSVAAFLKELNAAESATLDLTQVFDEKITQAGDRRQ